MVDWENAAMPLLSCSTPFDADSRTWLVMSRPGSSFLKRVDQEKAKRDVLVTTSFEFATRTAALPNDLETVAIGSTGSNRRSSTDKLSRRNEKSAELIHCSTANAEDNTHDVDDDESAQRGVTKEWVGCAHAVGQDQYGRLGRHERRIVHDGEGIDRSFEGFRPLWLDF
jgi:hypothetical protein